MRVQNNNNQQDNSKQAKCPCAYQNGSCKYGDKCHHIGKPLDVCLFHLQGKYTKYNKCNRLHIETQIARVTEAHKTIIIHSGALRVNYNKSFTGKKGLERLKDRNKDLANELKMMKLKQNYDKKIAKINTQLAVLSVKMVDEFDHAKERETQQSEVLRSEMKL